MALPLSHGVPSCHISHPLCRTLSKMFASLSALQCFWMSEPASALFRDQSNCCEFKTNIFHLKCHGRSAKQKRIVGNRRETTAGWSVYSSINSSVLMNSVRKLPLYWWRHGWSRDEKDSDCLQLQAELGECLFITWNWMIFLERAVKFWKVQSCSCLQPGTGVSPAAPALGVQDFIPSQGASVWAWEGKASAVVSPSLCVCV